MSVNVNLNHFTKVVSDEFLHYNVSLIPFVFNKNLGGDTLGVSKYSVSPHFSIHWWILLTIIINQCYNNDDDVP